MSASSSPDSSVSPVSLLYPDLENELSSTPLGALATHIAELPRIGALMMETDEIDVAVRQKKYPAKNSDELLALFEASVGLLTGALSKVTFADLEKPWTLRFGNHVLLSGMRRALMRTLLINHVIHHRAQLGVYYRLLGIPVPGLYGPSADEQL